MLGYTEEIAIRLYNLAEDCSAKMPNISIDYATSKLMKAIANEFIEVRDVEVFLNNTSQNNHIKLTIPELKKRIKYCRNPLEKKKLQQELNMAYKEQKKKE